MNQLTLWQCRVKWWKLTCVRKLLVSDILVSARIEKTVVAAACHCVALGRRAFCQTCFWLEQHFEFDVRESLAPPRQAISGAKTLKHDWDSLSRFRSVCISYFFIYFIYFTSLWKATRNVQLRTAFFSLQKEENNQTAGASPGPSCFHCSSSCSSNLMLSWSLFDSVCNFTLFHIDFFSGRSCCFA